MLVERVLPDITTASKGPAIVIVEGGNVREKPITPIAIRTDAPKGHWIESPYLTKGAGGGKVPVDESFVKGIIVSREKLTSSGITVGQEIANNCDSFFHLHDGSVLADLGCGPGLISCHLKSKVAPHGMIYCVDASELMLNKAITVMFGNNTKLIHGDIHVVDKLIPEKVDAVILSGNVHLITNREMAFRAIKRILKPDGKLIVVCHAYYHGSSQNTNPFANRVDELRESRPDIKVDGLRLPMLSERELNSIIKTIIRSGLSVNAYEKDTGSADSNMVFGYPPERTIVHRLQVTHPNYPEAALRSIASGIMSDVNSGRQAQVYLLCTNRDKFVSNPSTTSH